MYAKALPNDVDPIKFEQAWVQSRLFMLDIIHLIHELYEHGYSLHKTCLDVGPHLMGGTTLLKELHSPDSFTRLKLDISVIDLDDRFQEQCNKIDPDMEYLIGDVTKIDRAFDITICSHVIEHVPDPVKFCKSLQEKNT
jgi:2-polyprenyl-3-methyl-5-hydroxy-6-metoxy-1,4-benzoquinol methylase